MSFKIPMIKDKVQCQLYDQKKNCVELSKLSDGAEIICIIHIRGLKFLKQNYYCDCYISQIKVFLNKENKFSVFNEYAFNDKEEEEYEISELENDIRLDPDIIQSLEKEKEKEKENELKQLMINYPMLYRFKKIIISLLKIYNKN